MDRKLLDILLCPSTYQPLQKLKRDDLSLLNQAIANSQINRIDQKKQPTPFDAALITRDRTLIYRIDDGIPVLLIDEGVPTHQITGFSTT